MEDFFIRNASCLFDDKAKVTLEEIKKEWSDATILVLKRLTGSTLFLVGASGDYGVKLGEMVGLVSDETGRKTGVAEVVNVISYNESCTSKGNGIGMTEKFPVYVMK